MCSYDLTAIDTNDKIIPRLNTYFEVLVPQNLEAKGTVAVVGVLRRAIGVEA